MEDNEYYKSLHYGTEAENVEFLIKRYGVSAETVFEHIAGGDGISENLKLFAMRNVHPDDMLEKMEQSEVDARLMELLSLHANPTKIANRFDTEYMAKNAIALLRAGAKPKNVLGKLDSDTILQLLPELIEIGVKSISIMPRITEVKTGEQAILLLSHGATVQAVLGRVGSESRVDFVNKYLDDIMAECEKVKIFNILNCLTPWEIALCYNTLCRNGAEISLNALLDSGGSRVLTRGALDIFLGSKSDVKPERILKMLTPRQVADNIGILQDSGISPEKIKARLPADYLIENYSAEELIDIKIDFRALITECKMQRRNLIDDNFDKVVALGMDPDLILANISAKCANEHFDQLITLGVNPGSIIEKFKYNTRYCTADNAKRLMGAGADTSDIIEIFDSKPLGECVEALLTYNANPRELILSIDETAIIENIDLIIGRWFGDMLELLACLPLQAIIPACRILQNQSNFDNLVKELSTAEGVTKFLVAQEKAHISNENISIVTQKLRLFQMFLIHG